MRRGTVWTGLWLLAMAAGCNGPVERTPPERTLPFTVRVREVAVAEAAEAARSAVTPAAVEPRELTQDLRRALEEAVVFTRVLAEDDAATADLDLEVTVDGGDFGPGTPTLGGAVFSSLAWFFGGGLSWYIDNREYPDSQVRLDVVLRHAGQGEGEPGPEVYRDLLTLRGLRLNFLERSSVSRWFGSILLPPWVGDGDSAKAGRSLMGRTSAYFAENGVPRLRVLFPGDYMQRMKCFLSHDRQKGELLLVSREPLVEVTIAPEGGKARVLAQGEDLVPLEGVEEREALRRRLREDVVIGSDPNDRYYRIPLEPGERGFLRVEVEVEGITLPARGTVWRAWGGGARGGRGRSE